MQARLILVIIIQYIVRQWVAGSGYVRFDRITTEMSLWTEFIVQTKNCLGMFGKWNEYVQQMMLGGNE